MNDGAIGQPADPGEEPPDHESENLGQWGKPAEAQDHFVRHGKDFGAHSRAEYTRMAVEFREQAKTGKFLYKSDKFGNKRYYDPKTNTFGSYNSDETIRTFFKPPARSRYWANQPGSEP